MDSSSKTDERRVVLIGGGSSRSRLVIMAMAALLSSNAFVVVDPHDAPRQRVEQRTEPRSTKSQTIDEIVRHREVTADFYYAWETDPAVLSRPVADTMPTSPGVWSTPRLAEQTTRTRMRRHKLWVLVRQAD